MSTDSELADDIESLSDAVQRQNLEVREIVLAADVHVVLRGMRFHYLDWGNPGKRPILRPEQVENLTESLAHGTEHAHQRLRVLITDEASQHATGSRVGTCEDREHLSDAADHFADEAGNLAQRVEHCASDGWQSGRMRQS